MSVKLLSFPELSIIDKASRNLIGFIQISTMTVSKEAKVWFYAKHLPPMFKTLEQKQSTVNKRVLKCMFWGLTQQSSPLELSTGESKKLREIAEESSKLILDFPIIEFIFLY